MADDTPRETLNDLLKDSRTGLLTTIDDNGHLVSRPMALQVAEFDGDLWFFTSASSNKVAQISAEPAVNVSFENKGNWVSVTGTAEVSDDRNKAEELWNPFVKAYFPQGLDDPELRLIKVHADAAEYWKANAKPVALIKMMTAAATDTTPDLGENETVKL